MSSRRRTRTKSSARAAARAGDGPARSSGGRTPSAQRSAGRKAAEEQAGALPARRQRRVRGERKPEIQKPRGDEAAADGRPSLVARSTSSPPEFGSRRYRSRVPGQAPAQQPRENQAGLLPDAEKEMALLKQLGERVRDARLKSGLTQETAAAQADIDYKRWQRIEQGRVNATLRTLLRVAEVLNVETWRLLAPAKPKPDES